MVYRIAIVHTRSKDKVFKLLLKNISRKDRREVNHEGEITKVDQLPNITLSY